jgi:hypothetical protein
MQNGRFDPVTKKKKQQYEPLTTAPLIMFCSKNGTILLIIKFEAYFFFYVEAYFLAQMLGA